MSSDQERFWAKVDRRGPNDCWPWLAAVTDRGYGTFWVDGKQRYAHRLAWFLTEGTWPLELDHVCHDPAVCNVGGLCVHRRCVNPAHLEDVTHLENVQRGGAVVNLNAARTHCVNGHPFAGSNLLVRKNKGKPDGRRCLACRDEQHRRRRALRAAARECKG